MPTKRPKDADRDMATPDGEPSHGAPGPDATGPPPPGLDPARHAAAQRAAREAEILDRAVVPALMATALQLDHVESTGYRVYLDRLRAAAGNPNDPIECMLLEQLAMAHFR